MRTLSFFYPGLKSENTCRPHGFDGEKGKAGYKTINKLSKTGELKLAAYLKSEVDDWIQEMVDLHNIITHKSQLENYQSFLKIEVTSEIKTPLMPSGQKVEIYCQSVFDKLLNFYRTVFTIILYESKVKTNMLP